MQKVSGSSVIGFVAAVLFYAPVAWSGVPADVAAKCTTTEKIYSEEQISGASTTSEQKRLAVLMALGSDTAEPDFTVRSELGRWFYESETNGVYYAGFNIRSHYLGAAIVVTDDGYTTIICDSNNLKQTEKRIHKNAYKWKGELDRQLRNAVASIAAMPEKAGLGLANLESLYKSQYVTEKEYQAIKQRIEASQ